MLKKIVNRVCFIGFLLVILPLLWSVLVSGFNYFIDNDEFVHLQTTYLLMKGYNPYIDFFSIFSPIFHFTLIPAFSLSNFNFDTIILARTLMIIMFVLRVGVTLLFVRTLFGKTVSYISLPLLLFDPFTVYASMQIRPDNLALLLYFLGLLIFITAILKASGILYFSSGALLALSFLTSIKIFPSIMIFCFIFGIYWIFVKKTKTLLIFLSGFILVVFLFLFYFALRGSLPEMIQDVFINPVALSNRLFTPFGLFYNSGNGWLFGFEGKPPTWMYIWILPFFSTIGLFQVFKNSILTLEFHLKVAAKKREMEILKIILIISFILQAFILLFIRSVHIQYHLIPNWFLAIFAAIGLYEIYNSIKNIRHLKESLILVGLLLFVWFTRVSIQANFNRSSNNFYSQKNYFTQRWSKIPEGTLVYPYLLFRPPSYPLIVGFIISDIPDYILERFPPVISEIERNKIKYILLNDEFFKRQKPDVQEYIEENYLKVTGDDELWVKKQQQ